MLKKIAILILALILAACGGEPFQTVTSVASNTPFQPTRLPPAATATDTQPGAAPCDFAYLKQEIAQLRADGYVVIATNHWNQTYDYVPNPQQVIDFRLMVDWGASLVLGAQAHYAQTMEFYNDIFIHYGQGNLFFDQMGDQSWMPKGIRREFLDRYVIYNGKLISIELITTMLEDWSRPRVMTLEERTQFLIELFSASGW